jgi:hypothetical protein
MSARFSASGDEAPEEEFHPGYCFVDPHGIERKVSSIRIKRPPPSPSRRYRHRPMTRLDAYNVAIRFGIQTRMSVAVVPSADKKGYDLTVPAEWVERQLDDQPKPG